MVHKPQPGEREAAASSSPTRAPFAPPHPGPRGRGRPEPESLSVADAAPQPPWRPRIEADEVVPPAAPSRGRKARVRVLSGAVVAVILVAGLLWWSQTRTASEVTLLPPPESQTETMRITAPATGGASVDSSAKTGGSAVAPTERVASSSPPPSRRATKKATPAQDTPKAAANTSARNLALNSEATASSTEGGAWPPADAVDGDPGTRWSSGFSDPQWLRVDLGKVWQINEVGLDWENAHATSYRVELSTDLKKWKSVYSTTAGRSGQTTIDVAAVPARYVRVYGLERSTDYGYSLLELEVR